MMVSVKDLQAAKRLSMANWSSLSDGDRQLIHFLLGQMYRYYDDLATHNAFANGHIERLREALQMALVGEENWKLEAHAALASTAQPSTVDAQR